TGGFVIQTEKLDLPDLRLWEPATTFGSTGGQGTASWDGLPTSGYGKLRQYDVVFTDAAGDAVWSLPSTTPSLSFDLRLLEDSRGVAAVHARATAPAPSTPLDLDYRAPTTAYASAAGAPVSRGVPCTIGPPGGLVVTPCPLTDANFSATLGGAVRHPSPGPVPTGGSAANAPRPVPSSAIVDTNEVRGMTLVVVRGCAADCVVDVSANGTGWATLATVRGDAAIHPEGGTAVARYVRVSVATGDLAALREVSVWDQSVDPRAGTGLAQPGTRLLPSRSGRSGPTRVAWWLVAMAVALLLATSSATIVRLLTFRPLWKAFSGD
ncbi:MAG: hypothetical protein QOG03_115, partial [Actinomycetota bacterium]|nr:hypothetical protein [Actinomycetota bacterium]